MSTSWRHRRVRLPWGHLSVYMAGEGPPLLLLHGLGGSGRYWAGLAPWLAVSRTLIAPDLAGFGRSDKPQADYGRDFHVATLEGLLGDLRIDGPIGLAGHSMGGTLGALYAARHPERVASLVLTATPFPRTQVRPYAIPRSGVARSMYWTVQRVLPALSPLVRSATFPRAVVADYLRHTIDSYEKTSNALLWDPTLGKEFAGLAAALRGRPQLLLFSDEDKTIDRDNLGRWRDVLPDAEVKVMPGAHQLLLRDQFATVAAWHRNLPSEFTAGVSGLN